MADTRVLNETHEISVGYSVAAGRKKKQKWDSLIPEKKSRRIPPASYLEDNGEIVTDIEIQATEQFRYMKMRGWVHHVKDAGTQIVCNSNLGWIMPSRSVNTWMLYMNWNGRVEITFRPSVCTYVSRTITKIALDNTTAYKAPKTQYRGDRCS